MYYQQAHTLCLLEMSEKSDARHQHRPSAAAGSVQLPQFQRLIKQENTSFDSSSSSQEASGDDIILKPSKTQGTTNRQRWSSAEDNKLVELVRSNSKSLESSIGWSEISAYLPGRSEVQCRARWKNHLQPDLVKGPWTKEEDALVIDLVNKHGPRKWAFIAKHLKGKSFQI